MPDYLSGELISASPWFYAGADIGTVLRAVAIPGRVFYDSDGTAVQNPFDALQNASVNSARVETYMNCTGPTPPFDNSGDVLGRELLYELDFGCNDIQLQTAQLAKARGMQIVLTINLGTNIPEAWQGYNYTQVKAYTTSVR